jgi:hypothetical protein
MKGWYGFDLDSSIARYEGWEGHTDIGEPLGIEKMNSAFNILLGYLEQGKCCKIFTARAAHKECIKPIQNWCKKYLGQVLDITDRKDHDLIRFFDDRAIGVDSETGVPWQKIRKNDTLPHWEHRERTLP